jgi:hypothetical protein
MCCCCCFTSFFSLHEFSSYFRGEFVKQSIRFYPLSLPIGNQNKNKPICLHLHIEK